MAGRRLMVIQNHRAGLNLIRVGLRVVMLSLKVLSGRASVRLKQVVRVLKAANRVVTRAGQRGSLMALEGIAATGLSAVSINLKGILVEKMASGNLLVKENHLVTGNRREIESLLVIGSQQETGNHLAIENQQEIGNHLVTAKNALIQNQILIRKKVEKEGRKEDQGNHSMAQSVKGKAGLSATGQSVVSISHHSGLTTGQKVTVQDRKVRKAAAHIRTGETNLKVKGSRGVEMVRLKHIEDQISQISH